MAFSKVLNTVTTHFLKKPLLFNNFSKQQFESNARFLHSNVIRPVRIYDGDGDVCEKYFYPFQTSGSFKCFWNKLNKDCVYWRIDMPGVEKDGLKVWVENKTSIHVDGREKTDEFHLGVEECRSYAGGSCHVFPPGLWDVDNISVEMKYGVVKITVPRNWSYRFC